MLFLLSSLSSSAFISPSALCFHCYLLLYSLTLLLPSQYVWFSSFYCPLTHFFLSDGLVWSYILCVLAKLWSQKNLSVYLSQKRTFKNFSILPKFHMGQIWANFGATKLRGLITLKANAPEICNLVGMCCIMMSKMWQCTNFQFLSESRLLKIGQFWVPKWSNFQPFHFKFGMCACLRGICTWETIKFHLRSIWATPFLG